MIHNIPYNSIMKPLYEFLKYVDYSSSPHSSVEICGTFQLAFSKGAVKWKQAGELFTTARHH